MFSKFTKVTALIMAIMLGAGMIGACQKGEQTSGAAVSGSSAGSAVVSKTSVKASATATSKVSASKAASAASVTSGTQAAAGTGAIDGSGTMDASDDTSDVVDNGGTGSSNDNIVEELPAFDLKGMTINLAIPSAMFTRPFFSSGYSAEVDMFGKRLDYVEQKYNCKISLNLTVQKVDLAVNAIAGTYWNDIFMFTGAWLMESRNFIKPIDEYLDLSSPNARMNPHLYDVEWDGRYYGIPWQNKVNFDEYILYNRSIFGREGLPDPITLQSEKRWTWDVMLDCAIKATKDLNGDGVIDQWGIVIAKSSPSTVVERMVVSNGGGIISKEGDNYRFALGDPKSIKALQFISNIHNVYKCGIMNAANTHYQLGNAAMGVVAMSQVRTTKSAYPSESAYVMFPVGPDADRHIIWSKYVGGWACGMPLIVNKELGHEKVARLIYDLCALYDPTFSDYLTDVDVLSYLPSLFSEEDLKTVILEKEVTNQYGSYSDGYCYLVSTLINPLFNAKDSLLMKILNDNIAASTVIDSYSGMVQDQINSLINKYK